MADERETAIVTATEQLLAEGESFASLRVEQIAERAGLGRTNFYFYFRDKRDLLLRLADDAAQQLYERAGRWWHPSKDAPPDPAGEVEPIVRLFIARGSVLCAVVEGAAVDEEIRAHWRAVVQRFVDATSARIEAERDAGRAIGDHPSVQTAFALVWMTERACYQHFRDGTGDEAALGRALTHIWQLSIYGRGAP